MLTAAFVRTVQPAPRVRRYHDGNGTGLMLTVQATGTKQWNQRIMIHGKRRDLGLGSLPYVTLAQARARAFQNKAAVMQGDDPRIPPAPSFAQLVEQYQTLREPTWTANTRRNSRNQATHLVPTLGRLRVTAITASECLAVLTPLYANNHAGARAVRSLLRAVLDLAVACQHIASNPAGAALDAALPRLDRATKHHAALAYADLPAAFAALAATKETAQQLAARFLILTAKRHAEVRQMRWSEVDGATWTIPAERMKAKRAHVEPLSRQARAVLDAARTLNPDALYVFRATRKDAPLTDIMIPAALKRAGIAETVHGMRTTFRTWAGETGKRADLAEYALAHAVGSEVSRAYERTTYVADRAALMQEWAAFATGG